MPDIDRPQVEITADVKRRRLISRFSGFIKLEQALEAKRLYAEGLKKLDGKPYTALTYFDELRILAPEAVEVFVSIVQEAGNHQCLRSARVIRPDQSITRMQLDRIDSETKTYDARFFHDENEAISFLREAE